MNTLRKSSGALTVEACIALPIFMFVILTLASIMRVVYVENLIQHAINDSARELATYSYLYSVSGAQIADNTEKNALTERQKTANTHMDSLIASYSALNTVKDEMQEAEEQIIIDDEAARQKIKDIKANVSHGKTQIATILRDIKGIPYVAGKSVKNEVISIAALMATGAFENVSGDIAALAVQVLMKKHIAEEGKNEDQILQKLNVVNGFEGLDFSKTTLFSDKKTIDIIVSYDIKPIVPLNIIYPMHITQRVIINAWRDGDVSDGDISNATTSSEEYVWNSDSLTRGREIVDKQGGNIVSTTGGAISRYDETTGVTIKFRSIDPTMPTFLKKNGIYYSIKAEIDGISKYTGKVEIESQEGTIKTYDVKSKKMVVIIPKGVRTAIAEQEFEKCKAYAKSQGLQFEVVEFGIKPVIAPT